MKRIAAIALLSLPFAALAQAPAAPSAPEDPRIIEANDRMNALAGQRDEWANRAALIQAELAKTVRALEAAQKKCTPEPKKP